MNMVDLILLACTVVAPSNCREYHVLFQFEGSLRSCTMQAPPYLAQWAGDLPGYRVMRWRCAWPDQEGGKI